MKTLDGRRKVSAMNIGQLQQEVVELEKQIQRQAMAIELGQKKDVSTLRNLKKQLARTLTAANRIIRNH